MTCIACVIGYSDIRSSSCQHRKNCSNDSHFSAPKSQAYCAGDISGNSIAVRDRRDDIHFTWAFKSACGLQPRQPLVAEPAAGEDFIFLSLT